MIPVIGNGRRVLLAEDLNCDIIFTFSGLFQDRVRRYMDRVKEVQEKLKDKIEQPHLKKDAAKRFIRNALWMAAHNNSAGKFIQMA